MDRPARNLLAGTLVQYGLLAVNVVLGIFLMPFTIGHLGQAEYGLWMLVASFTAYFQLLDLGYGSGLVREVTHADARGDEDAVNSILSTFTVVYSVIGVATLALTAVFMLYVLPRFPTLSAAQLTTAQLVLAILGVRMAVGFPMSVFGAVTTARQRFALTGSIAIAAAVLQGAVTFVVLRAGYGLVPLVAATAALSVLSYVGYAAAARHVFPALRLSPKRFSASRVRSVTTFSFYLFLISIAMYLATSVDNIVIGAWMGTSAIAIYTVAARLSEYQRQLCGQFTGFLFPLVVRFHVSQDNEALRATLLDGTRIALALVTGCAICMIAFGRQVIELWMGAGFDGAIGALYVLAAAGIVMVAQGPTGTILLGTGRHRLVACASIAEIASNAVLSAVLVGSMGLTGVAVGTAVPYAVLNLFLLAPIACRAVNVSLTEFLRVVAVPTAVASIAAGAAAILVLRTGFDQSVVALLVQLSVVAAVYALTFWGIGLSAADRMRYVSSLRRAPASTGAVQPAVVS
jgi:O-antigen/teichoic acid export membrane protein